MTDDPYFDPDDAAKFEYLIEGTSLQNCIVAAGLSRHSKHVVQLDTVSLYGGLDTCVSFSEIDEIQKLNGVSDVSHTSYWDNPRARSHLIDVTHSRILLASCHSIKELIRLGVSGYLSFHSIRAIIVSGWELPLTRSKVFSDKRLRMQEKRSLMELLKTVAKDTNGAIHSSAITGGEGVHTMEISENISAVEYLAQFKIVQSELVLGLIHGVCLYPGPAADLSASDFVTRVQEFAHSINVYEEGCAFLVPTYGNGDLPQAFARAAAVAGAVQILGCDVDKVKKELSGATDNKCRHVSLDENTRRRVLRGIFVIRSEESHNDSLTLEIVTPINFHSPPIMCLQRNKSTDVIYDFFSFSDDRELFQDGVERYILDKKVEVVEKIFFSVHAHANHLHAFSIDSELDTATRKVNHLLGLQSDTPLPGPIHTDSE